MALSAEPFSFVSGFPFRLGVGDDVLLSGAEGVAYAANSLLRFGGGVSGALLAAAGESLRGACAEEVRARGELPVGRAWASPAFGLSSRGTRRIYHLVTLRMDPRSGRYVDGGRPLADLIARAVADALSQAAAEGLRSVAFPLMGTRVGGLRGAESVGAVFRGIHEFGTGALRTCSIREVVLCPLHSASAESAIREQAQLISFPLGRDMFANGHDAVVISANNWLVPGSGGARAAWQQAGSALWHAIEARRRAQAPLPMGTAFEGPAGDLERAGIRWLIHAVAMGYEAFDGRSARGRIPATPESVAAATRAALVRALALGATSLALPLMGARPGYNSLGERAAETMLASMLGAINELRPAIGAGSDARQGRSFSVALYAPAWLVRQEAGGP